LNIGYTVLVSSETQASFTLLIRVLIEFQLLGEVVPIMIAYACVGCVSAVMQLISVTLASAYVAQVSRKRMREKQQSWVCRNQLENQVLLFN